MKQAGSGVMFNLVGLRAPLQERGAAYAASMYGLVALTKAAAEELAPYGISVHVLGTGIQHLREAAPSVPTALVAAAFYLCQSELNGQIVNLEDR